MCGNRTGKGWFKQGNTGGPGAKLRLSPEQRKKNQYMCNHRYRKRVRPELKKLVYDHYGNKCACCDEKQILFLSVDHVNNDGYKKRLKGYDFYRSIIRDGYPDTYQLLCRNCNWGKQINGGICPHKK